MSSINNKPPGLAPEGYHLARVTGVIELGTIYVYQHWKKMLRLEFELPEQNRVFNINEPAKPKIVSREYAASLYGKSNLKEHLNTWMGESFIKTMESNFDVSMLLCQPCTIRIIHKLSNTDKWYEEITEIHGLGDDEVCPPQFYKARALILNENFFDRTLFDSLPEFLQAKIKGSQEYMKMFPFDSNKSADVAAANQAAAGKRIW